MTNVKDLNVENEIIPLFDYTNNRYSKNILNGLFNQLPKSMEEVRERQQIIKGLIANWDKLHTFSYQRLELEEIYQLFENIKNRKLTFERNKLKSKFQLFFSNKEKYRKRGQYIQMIVFFERLYTKYLAVIDGTMFPDRFKLRIDKMNRFLQSFDVTNNASLIRNDSSLISHIIEIEQIINNKIASNEIVFFWENFFLFDAYLSIAKGVIQHKFNFPVFNDSELSVEEFYHPLIKDPVKNSITAIGNVILITGPNMSGKSTLLKSLGLCIYLSHIGLAVPAFKCEIPYFNVISIAINLNDDIINGYSHFMTEIKNLKHIVVEAKNEKKCFAVFDELFRGTNIDDALDITKMTIKGVLKFKSSYFFISTHLHQLKDLIEADKDNIEYYNIECILNQGTPLFSYKLNRGWSDLKIGKILFEKEGLNQLLE